MAYITIVNAPAGVQLCGSPVVVGVKVPKGYFTRTDELRTLRMVKMRVYKDSVSASNPYATIEWEAESDAADVTYDIDIQTALRSLIDRIELEPGDSLNGSSLPMLKYALEVGGSYLRDGYIFDDFARNLTTSSSGNMYAINGTLTDYERSVLFASGNASVCQNKAVRLSRKPSGEIACTGSTHVVSTLPKATSEQVAPSVTCTAVSAASASQLGVYAVPEDGYRQFIFINQLGGMESVCARTLESCAYNIEKKSYERATRPSMKPDSRGYTMSQRIGRTYIQMEMSSGYCNREWAMWWVSEFLAAERYWVKINDAWIPCSVTPKSKNVSIYDNSKAEGLHVDFTVELGYDGPVSLSIL